MSINILPDKKLFTKHIYTIITISLAIVFLCTLLQFLIPLDPNITVEQAGSIIWPICGGVILLLMIVALPIMKLWVNNLSYSIEDDRLTVKKGIISKIEQNIPFIAVTDFMLHRSLYDRILGIASIRIQTAGQSANPAGYEGAFSGLINYETLYSELRNKLKAATKSSDKNENVFSNFSTPDLLTKILMELTTIREMMEDKRK